jgi:tetratricopeptide (TPR) repeat protein
MGTDAVFAAAGDLRNQALALGNQAAALEALRRRDEAMALYQQSADLLKQVGESELRAYVMQAVSKLQFRSGNYFEALASMRLGLEGIRNPTLKQRILIRLLRIPMRSLGAQ